MNLNKFVLQSELQKKAVTKIAEYHKEQIERNFISEIYKEGFSKILGQLKNPMIDYILFDNIGLKVLIDLSRYVHESNADNFTLDEWYALDSFRDKVKHRYNFFKNNKHMTKYIHIK